MPRTRRSSWSATSPSAAAPCGALISTIRAVERLLSWVLRTSRAACCVQRTPVSSTPGRGCRSRPRSSELAQHGVLGRAEVDGDRLVAQSAIEVQRRSSVRRVVIGRATGSRRRSNRRRCRRRAPRRYAGAGARSAAGRAASTRSHSVSTERLAQQAQRSARCDRASNPSAPERAVPRGDGVRAARRKQRWEGVLGVPTAWTTTRSRNRDRCGRRGGRARRDSPSPYATRGDDPRTALLRTDAPAPRSKVKRRTPPGTVSATSSVPPPKTAPRPAEAASSASGAPSAGEHSPYPSASSATANRPESSTASASASGRADPDGPRGERRPPDSRRWIRALPRLRDQRSRRAARTRHRGDRGRSRVSIRSRRSCADTTAENECEQPSRSASMTTSAPPRSAGEGHGIDPPHLAVEPRGLGGRRASPAGAGTGRRTRRAGLLVEHRHAECPSSATEPGAAAGSGRSRARPPRPAIVHRVEALQRDGGGIRDVHATEGVDGESGGLDHWPLAVARPGEIARRAQSIRGRVRGDGVGGAATRAGRERSARRGRVVERAQRVGSRRRRQHEREGRQRDERRSAGSPGTRGGPPLIRSSRAPRGGTRWVFPTVRTRCPRAARRRRGAGVSGRGIALTSDSRSPARAPVCPQPGTLGGLPLVPVALEARSIRPLPGVGALISCSAM